MKLPRHPVRGMFDGIARRYDFMNHFLSLGRDKAWRKAALKLLPPREAPRVIDLCAGTGDFLGQSCYLGQPRAHGIVSDFSYNMLARAPQKYPKAHAVQADAQQLPFPDGCAHIVLNGFGLRNLDRLEDGLREAHRILVPCGHLLILEFFRPVRFCSRVFHGILAPLFIPLAGRLLARSPEAYQYLLRSIRGFLSIDEFAQLCGHCGFRVHTIRSCDGGIAHIVLLERIQTSEAGDPA